MATNDPYITAPSRGRARSHSMHEDIDGDVLDDLDALNIGTDGIPGTDDGSAANSGAGKRKSSRGGAQVESSDGTQGSSTSSAGKLSRKTINMLTNLEEAAKTVPPELEHTVDRVLTEEELAERELAEQEKRRRQATAAEGGGHAHASGSAGPAGASSGGSLGSSASTLGGLSGGPGRPGIPSSLAPVVTATAGGGRAEGGGPGPGRRSGDKPFDVLVKLLLLGDSGVGKTSLLNRYAEDKFSPSLLSTAGVDYKTQLLEVGGQTVKCQIWDTAGQQRFHVITQAYYRGAHGIVLVYDASDPSEESFHNVRYWMDNIAKHASGGVAKMLLGNKIDVKGKRIDTARGKALADEYGALFFETSAKDGTGVKGAFHALAALAVATADGSTAGGAGAGGGGVKQIKGGKGKDGKDCSIM